MRYSDFYQMYKQLRDQELQELAAAVKAYGDEYIFIDCDGDDAKEKWYERGDYDNLPIVHGSTKYLDGYDDYYVSRVKVNEYGGVTIYGFRTDGDNPDDEDYLEHIMPGHICCIIDFIPETETVKDVSINK